MAKQTGRRFTAKVWKLEDGKRKKVGKTAILRAENHAQALAQVSAFLSDLPSAALADIVRVQIDEPQEAVDSAGNPFA